MTEKRQSFGYKLTQYRIKRGWTEAQLADALVKTPDGSNPFFDCMDIKEGHAPSNGFLDRLRFVMDNHKARNPLSRIDIYRRQLDKYCSVSQDRDDSISQPEKLQMLLPHILASMGMTELNLVKAMAGERSAIDAHTIAAWEHGKQVPDKKICGDLAVIFDLSGEEANAFDAARGEALTTRVRLQRQPASDALNESMRIAASEIKNGIKEILVRNNLWSSECPKICYVNAKLGHHEKEDLKALLAAKIDKHAEQLGTQLSDVDKRSFYDLMDRWKEWSAAVLEPDKGASR